MPGVATRVLEKTLSHLSNTLEQAEQAHRTARGTAPVQALDARVKVVSAALLSIAAVSSSSLEVILPLLAALTACALLSGIRWPRLLTTWASGLFFAAIIAIPAIFTTGPKIAALLVSRSEACLTCWLLVIMTTPFNRVLLALRALRVPSVFVAILAMTFRYIFLLVETSHDMLLSRRSRIVGRMSPSDNRRLLAGTAGVLLGKSIQMSDDVFHAMASRGFRGEIHMLDDFQMRTADWAVLATVAILSTLIFLASR
jgi:cobalt/nickel transport system permease protein